MKAMKYVTTIHSFGTQSISLVFVVKGEQYAAFDAARGPAAEALDAFIAEEMEALTAAATEKQTAAQEVMDYLSENFTRYMQELLEHAYHGHTQEERDDLVAYALLGSGDPTPMTVLLGDVSKLNSQLVNAMAA